MLTHNSPEKTADLFISQIMLRKNDLEAHGIPFCIVEYDRKIMDTLVNICAEKRIYFAADYAEVNTIPRALFTISDNHKLEVCLADLDMSDSYYMQPGVCCAVFNQHNFFVKRNLNISADTVCHNKKINTILEATVNSKQNIELLKEAYIEGLQKNSSHIEEVHIILLGTGNLNYKVKESIDGLMLAIEHLEQTNNLPSKIVLHIKSSDSKTYQKCI